MNRSMTNRIHILSGDGRLAIETENPVRVDSQTGTIYE